MGTTVVGDAINIHIYWLNKTLEIQESFRKTTTKWNFKLNEYQHLELYGPGLEKWCPDTNHALWKAVEQKVKEQYHNEIDGILLEE